jgi:Raf kinase inhibitor-like YbhB/YbcL family protein
MRKLLGLQIGAASVLLVIVACSSESSSSSSSSSTSSSGGSSSGDTSSSSSGNTSSSSGSSSGGSDAGVDATDGASGTFTLTSTALAEGASFNAANTCNGANTSPPLKWTNGPTGTQSYAIVFTDKSNNLVHSVIYDIPGNRFELPANVQKAYEPNNVTAAKQTTAYDNNTRGYLGPCPPNEHTYEFALYAIDVAQLPGVTMATTRAQIVPIIQAHDLATATLTGKYKQP